MASALRDSFTGCASSDKGTGCAPCLAGKTCTKPATQKAGALMISL